MTGTKRFKHRALLWALAAVALCASVTVVPWGLLRGETEAHDPSDQDAIALSSRYGQSWAEGDEEVLMLRGACRLVQGPLVLTSQKMVVWRRRSGSGRSALEQLTVYLEGDVRAEQPGATSTENTAIVSLVTRAGISEEVLRRVTDEPATEDALYLRGAERRKASGRSLLQQTQLVLPGEPVAGPEMRSVQLQPTPGNLRRVRISPRSAVPFNVESRRSDRTTPPEQVWIITGGVNVLVEGVDQLGTVDMAADRVVIWTQANTTEEFSAETVQTKDTPFTVYLEGNIVIRQGQSIVRASNAVYDARDDRALLLNAELKAFVPQLQGNLRVRADRIRQLSQRSYQAQNAWVTGSQFGRPGYRLQSSDVYLEYRDPNPWIGPRPAAIDPQTGRPVDRQVPYVTSLNNTFFVEEVPLLYVPRIAGPIDDPPIPLRNIRFQQDSIFGTQVKTTWDMFQLIGLEEPDGVRWDLLADYLSDRGPAIGTQGQYAGEGLFGLPGTFVGEGIGYYINDQGEDNLGADRGSLEPETEDRYRASLKHRQNLPYNITLWGELGLLSDRNFLEQYFENDFDEGKDIENLLYAKQQVDNWAWTLLGRVEPNEFENTTEWLPKGDLYFLGQPLLGGWLTYSTHSSAGYANLNQAEPPTDPQDVFTPLPYFADVEGGVFMTRHELNAPFDLGPLNITPYALGEAAFWNEDLTGDQLDRLVGSAGVRSSLMFWKPYPFVQSRIFGLNGLAHKVLLEADYSVTDVTEGLGGIPQYNEFDDNAQERFRQRYPINTFGGMVPPQFDPRSYAVRTGAGLMLTAPWHELVDDQQVLRMALRQRLQTKVGPPDNLRIKDWMLLDLEASFFPNPDRDNFGEDIGLLGANYVWNVGDRTSILASAYYDLFEDAQQLWSVGVVSQRSERGSIYLGYRQVSGAGLDSQIATASYSYRMSPKWISTLGTAYDVAEGRNLGQSLTVTRVGADFLVHVGANFDESKDNAGLAISIEPRFGPFNSSSTQLSSLLGIR